MACAASSTTERACGDIEMGGVGAQAEQVNGDDGLAA
jgi:hypothetical protein